MIIFEGFDMIIFEGFDMIIFEGFDMIIFENLDKYLEYVSYGMPIQQNKVHI